MPLTPRTKGRLAVAALVVLLAALATTVAASPRIRVKLRILALRRALASPNEAERHRARSALLDIGRPAIDSLLPEIIAGELLDHAGPRAVFTVAQRRTVAAPLNTDAETYDLAPRDILERPMPKIAPIWTTPTPNEPVQLHWDPIQCEVFFWLSYARAHRRLAIVAPSATGGEYRVVESIPLHADVENPLLDLLRARLAR
jgi:hypothetical protein